MCPLTSEPQVLISHAPTPDTVGHRTPRPSWRTSWAVERSPRRVLDLAETKCKAAQETADRKHTDMPLPHRCLRKWSGGRGQFFRFSLEGPALGKCQMFAGYMKHLVLLPRENCI